MSSVFRISKTKVNQEELRRLMRLKQQEQQKQETKIDSPLAKYEGSQLTCAVCRTPVAPKAWRAHLNSRKHADQVEASRALRQRSLQPKRPATPPPQPPAKKIRGILKNAPAPVQPMETDEDSSIDSEFNQTTNVPVKLMVQSENDSNKGLSEAILMYIFIISHNIISHFSLLNSGSDSAKPNEAESDEALPEGFFDDPIMDAKVIFNLSGTRFIFAKNPKLKMKIYLFGMEYEKSV